jgi:hypothetical protein
VKGPKALCELQGYVYDAWLRMAEIFEALGNRPAPSELRRKAAKLFKRFNEAFWDEESGFYAFCLDGEKKPVLSVASNPATCSGRHRAAGARGRVVERLLAPDMWSGWGIRTLSSDAPGLQPALLPERFGLAARQQPDRAGISPLRLRPRGRPGRPRRQRRGRLLHAAPDAGTLRRPEARADQLPGAVQGRQRAPGLGGGLAVSACCRPWSASSRTPRPASSTSIRRCPTGCRTCA